MILVRGFNVVKFFSYSPFFLLLFLLLFSSSANSAIRPTHPHFNALKSKILELERDLENKNVQYVKEIEKIKNIDNEIQKLSLQLEEGQKKLRENKIKAKKIVGAQVLNNIDDKGANLEKVYQQQMFKKMLDQQLVQIDSNLRFNDLLIDELNKLKDRLFEHNLLVENLSSIMVNLEEKKKKMTTVYAKDFLNQKEEKIVKGKGDSNLKKLIVSPLDEYSEFKKENKGISFSYSGVKPIKAIRKGRVVHIGKLGNYGNIIIIDHGNELRTVLLGEIKVLAKKDSDVESMEVLGYALASENGQSQLYFEVRQKNQVLDVHSWPFNKI